MERKKRFIDFALPVAANMNAGRIVSHMYGSRITLYTCTFPVFYDACTRWVVPPFRSLFLLIWNKFNSQKGWPLLGVRGLRDRRNVSAPNHGITDFCGHFANWLTGGAEDSLLMRISARSITFACITDDKQSNNRTCIIMLFNIRMGQWWNACRAAHAIDESKWKVKVAKS